MINLRQVYGVKGKLAGDMDGDGVHAGYSSALDRGFEALVISDAVA
jgi:hypothetical protein